MPSLAVRQPAAVKRLRSRRGRFTILSRAPEAQARGRARASRSVA